MRCPAGLRTGRRPVAGRTTGRCGSGPRRAPIGDRRRKRNFDRLGQRANASQKGDAISFQSERKSLAVPVFIEMKDGCRRRFGEAELADDVGAAFTANLDHSAGPLRAASHNGRHFQQPVNHRAARSAVPPAMFHGIAGTREIGHSGRALDGPVVSAEQVRHLGRIARATQILQEERIKQGRTIRRGEADRFGQAHADEGRPHAMPLRLPLRDIQRDRERGNDFREANLGGLNQPPRGGQSRGSVRVHTEGVRHERVSSSGKFRR